MKRISILFIFFTLILSFCEKDEPEPEPDLNANWTAGDEWIDTRDGQSYATVQIGDQTWMAENLNAAKYTDGTIIPKVEGKEEWANLGSLDKGYCWYQNDSAEYAEVYGALYTWTAAMNGEGGSNSNPSDKQGVCPTDWHMPSDLEWWQLITYLGGSDIAGDKL